MNHLAPLSSMERLYVVARGEILDTPMNMIHYVQPLRYVLLHLQLLPLLILEQSMSEHQGRYVF